MTTAKKPSQNDRILSVMINNGYITDLIARNYGVRRLASRIHELKQEGCMVVTETCYDEQGVKYAKYSLLSREAERVRLEKGMSWRLGKLQAA